MWRSLLGGKFELHFVVVAHATLLCQRNECVSYRSKEYTQRQPTAELLEKFSWNWHYTSLSHMIVTIFLCITYII